MSESTTAMTTTSADEPLLIQACAPAEWNDWVAQFEDDSIYQSWEYEEAREDAKHTEVSRLGIEENGSRIAAAQVRVKRIPVVGGGLAYVYRGPVWRREDSKAAHLRTALGRLRQTFVDEQRLTLRIVPNVAQDGCADAIERAFEETGFRKEKGGNPEKTIVLDLAEPATELRKRFAQKWRNGLNQAERQRLEVTTGCSGDDWARFENLYNVMWAEKRFDTGVSVTTFGQLQKALTQARKMTVRLAWLEGRPVAGHVSSMLGNTCVYLLGASIDAGRKSRAAYLLQWRALLMAQEQGARRYDLGGIDPAANPGVYHFKSGMGGLETEMLPPFVATPSGARSLITSVAERAYRGLHRKGGERVAAR